MTRPEPKDAYPLQWPHGWPRTEPHLRKRGRYEVTMAVARDHVLKELRLLGAKWIVINSNIQLRRDGLPYAQFKEPDDSGIAVYWLDKRGKERVCACDCWASARENTRAIGLTISALRGIERAGASDLLDRAFEGFLALPAHIVPARQWRRVLGLNGAPITVGLVEATYRALAKVRHPDTPGGSHEQMTELNLAYLEARQELQP